MSRLHGSLDSGAALVLLLLGGCGADDDDDAGLAGRPDEVLAVAVDVNTPYMSEFALNVYYPDAPGPWPVAVVFHRGEEPLSSVQAYVAGCRGGVVWFQMSVARSSS